MFFNCLTYMASFVPTELICILKLENFILNNLIKKLKRIQSTLRLGAPANR